MKIAIKLAFISAFFLILAGCTGTTYNSAKNCTYDYILHPEISIPRQLNFCDDVN